MGITGIRWYTHKVLLTLQIGFMPTGIGLLGGTWYGLSRMVSFKVASANLWALFKRSTQEANDVLQAYQD